MTYPILCDSSSRELSLAGIRGQRLYSVRQIIEYNINRCFKRLRNMVDRVSFLPALSRRVTVVLHS